MIERDYDSDFAHLVGPQVLCRSLNTLEGILEGIAIDKKINKNEVEALNKWLDDHKQYANSHPYNELIPLVRDSVKDGILDEEEKLDIIWLCNRITENSEFFDIVTADLQALQGIMGGIIADGVISKEEVAGLQAWMDDQTHLKASWPYDEIESVIISVLEDGVIDNQEHSMMLHFFDEVSDFKKYRKSNPKVEKQRMAISGVCALCPEIEIKHKLFCLTGKSERMTRGKIADEIAERGGYFTNQISKHVDYLVVGNAGNPAWGFSCYGRKIEAAMNWRKDIFMARNLGHQVPHDLVIVHENDFWDAIEDFEPLDSEPNPGRFALELARYNIPYLKHDTAISIVGSFENMEDFLTHTDDRLRDCNLDEVRYTEIKNWLIEYQKSY